MLLAGVVGASMAVSDISSPTHRVFYLLLLTLDTCDGLSFNTSLPAPVVLCGCLVQCDLYGHPLYASPIDLPFSSMCSVPQACIVFDKKRKRAKLREVISFHVCLPQPLKLRARKLMDDSWVHIGCAVASTSQKLI